MAEVEPLPLRELEALLPVQAMQARLCEGALMRVGEGREAEEQREVIDEAEQEPQHGRVDGQEQVVAATRTGRWTLERRQRVTEAAQMPPRLPGSQLTLIAQLVLRYLSPMRQ